LDGGRHIESGALTFSPDGGQLAYGSRAAYSPSGNNIAATSQMESCQILDMQFNGAKTNLPSIKPGTYLGKQQFAAGMFPLPRDRYNTASVIWNSLTGVRTTVTSGGGYDITWNTGGDQLLSCLDDTITVWNSDTGEQAGKLKWPRAEFGYSPTGAWTMTRVQSSPTGQLVAGWKPFHSGVSLFDLKSGKAIGYLPTKCVAATFSPDGGSLATGDSSGLIRIWDLGRFRIRNGIKEFAAVRELHGHEDVVAALAFNSDGTRLASGSEDCTVRVWDVALGRSMLTLRSPDGPVHALAFDPQDRRLATGNTSGVRIWEGQTRGQLLVRVKDAIVFAQKWAPRVESWIEQSHGDNAFVESMFNRKQSQLTPAEQSTLRSLVLQKVVNQRTPSNDQQQQNQTSVTGSL